MASYCVCIAVFGVAFIRWRERSRAVQSTGTGWKNFGWFTALSWAGSFTGLIAYASRTATLDQVYRTMREVLLLSSSPSSRALLKSIYEYRSRWQIFSAIFFLLKPVELTLVIIAHLLVLHRLLRMAVMNSSRQKTWIFASRVFVVCVRPPPHTNLLFEAFLTALP
jgi:hypothetical protein